MHLTVVVIESLYVFPALYLQSHRRVALNKEADKQFQWNLERANKGRTQGGRVEGFNNVGNFTQQCIQIKGEIEEESVS